MMLIVIYLHKFKNVLVKQFDTDTNQNQIKTLQFISTMSFYHKKSKLNHIRPGSAGSCCSRAKFKAFKIFADGSFSFSDI